MTGLTARASVAAARVEAAVFRAVAPAPGSAWALKASTAARIRRLAACRASRKRCKSGRAEQSRHVESRSKCYWNLNFRAPIQPRMSAPASMAATCGMATDESYPKFTSL